MKKRPVGLIIMVVIFIVASVTVTSIFIRNWVNVFSGHSDLTGEIIAERRSLRVGETVPLELIVPDRFDSVNRLSWTLAPERAGKISYTQVAPEDKIGREGRRVIYPVYDRKAYLTVERPGICVVQVSGYYSKGDRPRLIAKLELAVTP